MVLHAFLEFSELLNSNAKIYVKSKKINFLEVKRAIYKRNLMDRSRRISPLQKHPDAVVVNTTKIDKKAMLAKMSVNVERALKLKYGI